MKRILPVSFFFFLFLGMVAGQNQVCVPAYTFDCVASSLYIDSVKTLNAVTNFSSLATDCNAQDKNYIDYVNKIAVEAAGGTFQLHVGLFNQSSAHLGVWIDWNNDHVLALNEQIYMTTNPITSVTFAVNVPFTATLDTLIMRVRCGSIPPGPCDSIAAGETEDYHLLVYDGAGIFKTDQTPQWKLFPNPAQDHITIDLKTGQEKMNFVLTDLLGNNISKNEAKNGICVFDLSDLPHGMYFIRDNFGGTVKFIH